MACAQAVVVSFFVHTCGHGTDMPVTEFIPGWLADVTALILITGFVIGWPAVSLYMILDKSDSDRFGTVVIGIGGLIIWTIAVGSFVYAVWLR